jgi:hypothetical protein
VLTVVIGIGSVYFFFYIALSGIIFDCSKKDTKILKSIATNFFASILFSGLLVGINSVYMIFYTLYSITPGENVFVAHSYIKAYITLFLFFCIIFCISALITSVLKNILLINKKNNTT